MNLPNRTRRRLWSLLAYGLGPALGLLSAPLLARALGPEGRGEFASITQPMTVVTGLAAMGVPTAVAYFVSAGYDPPLALRRSMVVVTPVCVITYALMSGYAVLLSQETGIALWVFLIVWLLIPVGAYINVVRGYLQGLQAWARLDVERTLVALLRFLTVVALVATGVASAVVYGIAVSWVIVLASVVLIGVRATRRTRPVAWMSLARYSIAAWPMTVALYVGARLDQALLPAAGSVEQLGYYTVAATVAEAPLIVSTLIAREALPAAASGHSVWSIVRDGWLYWSLLAAASGGLLIVAPALVPAVFGEAFTSSVAAVQILGVASLGAAGLTFQSAVLAGRGHPKASAVGPLASVASTLMLFAFFWGGVGSTDAAAVALTSQIAGCLVGAATMRRVPRPSPAPPADALHEGGPDDHHTIGR